MGATSLNKLCISDRPIHNSESGREHGEEGLMAGIRARERSTFEGKVRGRNLPLQSVAPLVSDRLFQA